MLKHYGIDKSQAMAFGDGNNDIEMLKAVGNGIAMANASDDLKAVADEICGDVSEDGIYHYCLEKRLIWAADEGDEFCPRCDANLTLQKKILNMEKRTMKPLYAKDKRDACIIVAVNYRKYDLGDIDEILENQRLTKLSKGIE